MSNVIILGDTHLGARNGSAHFSDYFNRFFNEVLYPYCLKNNVKHILQLGDLFDNRTNLVYKSLYRSKDIWFKKMGDLGITFHVLLGNHDICYRHTLQINSPSLLLGEYDHIKIYDKPTELELDGIKFDILPWICDENEKEIKEFISRKNKGSVCLGHLELSGFQMYKGIEAHGGESRILFDHYPLVFSGHYHTRSEKGNIIYTGTPYEITWSDYSDPKGFYSFDTITRKYSFIQNPNTMFEKIYYNNGSKVDISKLQGKIVKILVGEKKDAVAYERWLDSIRLVQPYELSIIEADSSQMESQLDDSIEIEDTPSIIKNYIEGIDTSVQKDDLNKYMQTLYFEALTVDDTL